MPSRRKLSQAEHWLSLQISKSMSLAVSHTLREQPPPREGARQEYSQRGPGKFLPQRPPPFLRTFPALQADIRAVTMKKTQELFHLDIWLDYPSGWISSDYLEKNYVSKAEQKPVPARIRRHLEQVLHRNQPQACSRAERSLVTFRRLSDMRK